jgi:AcrR family transcriptional regulator
MATGTRARLLERAADFVLEQGLAQATLRPLARAAGTSDRMLVYHFGGKDRLVAEVLDLLAQRLADLLAAALPGPPAADAWDELPRLLALLRAPEAQGYGRLWLDILARAARGEPGFGEAAGRIMDLFLDWLVRRQPPGTAEARGTAAAVLTLVEGALVMEAAGRRATAEEALARLAALMAPAPLGRAASRPGAGRGRGRSPP